MGTAKGDHSPSKTVDLFVLFEQAPIEPAHFVILAVGIVIAELGSAKFIPAEQHGNASRDKQGQQKILNQTDPDTLDSWILTWPFHAAIVAIVGIGSIAAELSIFVIVLLLVADQVVEREAVMTSHEVEAACGALA